MLVAPQFYLVNVLIDGINVIMNSEDAREIRGKYPDAKVSRLRKNKKVGHSHGPVTIINPAEYNLGKII